MLSHLMVATMIVHHLSIWYANSEFVMGQILLTDTPADCTPLSTTPTTTGQVVIDGLTRIAVQTLPTVLVDIFTIYLMPRIVWVDVNGAFETGWVAPKYRLAFWGSVLISFIPGSVASIPLSFSLIQRQVCRS